MQVKTTVYGYPKIGRNRELKRALESFWNGKTDFSSFWSESLRIYQERQDQLKNAGVDYRVRGDFSLYDFVLDHSLLFSVVPERFGSLGTSLEKELELYFAMARGNQKNTACSMTKWFDTNYHYIVPELSGEFRLNRDSSFLLGHKAMGGNLSSFDIPYLLGPLTYVFLGKGSKTQSVQDKDFFLKCVENLIPLYRELLEGWQKEGVTWVHLDEPVLVLEDLPISSDEVISLYQEMRKGLSSSSSDKGISISLITYYDSLYNYEKILFGLPVEAVALDFVSNSENRENLNRHGFPKDKILIAGIVSGRDPWKSHLGKKLDWINKEVIPQLSLENLVLAPSCPLFHLPHSKKEESGHLEEELLDLLSFADERLLELQLLRDALNHGKDIPAEYQRSFVNLGVNESVQKRLKDLEGSEIARATSFSNRYAIQKEALQFPLVPTTTIGSFPQTAELRKKRLAYRRGELSQKEYQGYIQEKISEVIRLQEDLGLDILVHGEFERTDMVEFFAEKLEGFAFTKNGWVQSYGSRCVRPPILYADLSRPSAMTLEEILYAQSQSQKPVKGMLTGPITILHWSFYRPDIAPKEIASQIALALLDEVLDLEKAGVCMIQIDEPAFREAVPLRKSQQKDYFDWAIRVFRMTHYSVKDSTQIHTHMCYSDFANVMEAIQSMDADVLYIESSRSGDELVQVLRRFPYDNALGLGVYDIHSPRVPSLEEMKRVMQLSLEVMKPHLIWINPDCGLKTRNQREAQESLKNMVLAAQDFKSRF